MTKSEATPHPFKERMPNPTPRMSPARCSKPSLSNRAAPGHGREGLALWPVRTQMVVGVVASLPFGLRCGAGLSGAGFQQRDSEQVLMVQSGAGTEWRSARAVG